MSNSENRRKKILDFDELIAVIVAFTTIGAILFWSFTNRKNVFTFSSVSTKSENQEKDIKPKETTQSPEIKQQEQPEQVVILEKAAPDSVETLPTNTNNEVKKTPPLIPVIVAPQETNTPPVEPQTPEVVTPPPTVEPEAVTPPTTEPQPTAVITFNDVPETYWASPFIYKLVEQKVIQGFPDENFQPDKPLTRAELASQITQIFSDNSETEQVVQFQDITEEHWASKAIDKVVKIGFMRGYSEGVFRPDQSVTRLEFLVALATGLKLQNTKDAREVLSYYQDNQQLPEWAVNQIAAATEAGLVINHPDKTILNPNQPATRAEAAAMIHQALVSQGKLEPITSEYIVQTPQ